MEVGFPDGAVVKNLPANAEDARGFEPWVGKIPWRRKWQPTLVLAWKIPWTEEPGGLQSMGSQRVGHDWACTCTHKCMKVKSYQPHSLRQGSTNFFYRGSDSKDVHIAGVLVFSCYQHVITNSKHHPLIFFISWFPQVRSEGQVAPYQGLTRLRSK